MHISRLIIERRTTKKNQAGHPCHMLLPVQLNSGLKVDVIQCSYLSNGAGCSLIKVADNGSGYSEEDFLKSPHSSLMGECSMVRVGKNQYMATVMNNNCELATFLSESGCFLTSAVPQNDYIIEWTLIAPNSTYITNLITRIRSEGYKVEKISSELMDVDILLTPRQEEILEYAFENGYYDSPKKINIDDLCKKFDCSKSTMSVILKGAEKKVIGAYVNINRSNGYY